jgi:hypothetical protein
MNANDSYPGHEYLIIKNLEILLKDENILTS